MYLSDIIREKINPELEKLCVNKTITFHDFEEKEQTIKCKSVKFCDDDGDCWIKFTDENNKTYMTSGQGIDIWFEISE